MASPSDVLAMITDGGYDFVDLRFCDLPGQVQHFTIPASELDEGGFEEGFGFDGSSVTGFHAIEESDTLAMPDPSTFSILPWDTGEMTECRMFWRT